MITDGILLVFQGLINIILSPLSIINISVDFISSITLVTQFLQIVSYILPWSNLMPLITLIITLSLFRIAVALVKLVVEFIPFMEGVLC